MAGKPFVDAFPTMADCMLAELPLCVGKPLFAAAPSSSAHNAATIPADWLASLSSNPAAAFAGLGGDFAMAVRDHQGRIHLAVDRFAAQTLCYRVDNGQLRFDIRADALGDASTAVDPQAIYEYMFLHVIPSPRTIFEGVHRLPPGHHAVFDQGRITVSPYWQPDFGHQHANPSFDTLRDEFMALLRQAVRRQLDGTKPACFLSGGTDSSSVAGLIRDVTGQAAAGYSIGFEAEGYDEMSYARLAAKHFGVEHHEYYVTPDDLVQSIGKVAVHFDQPFGNSSALPAYYCALQARADGVTRMLAGDGGDELFGGNTRYAKQRVFGLYGRLPAGFRHAVMEPLFDNAVMHKMPLLRKGARYVEQARVPMPERLQMYNLLRFLGTVDVLTPGFLNQVKPQSLADDQQRVWDAAGNASDIDCMLAFDWRYTLAENDLPKVRSSTSLAGVSVGYPLLDRDLLDFAIRLPPRYKLKGLELRWFFKEALRGFLPEEIIKKQKHGFGLPFGVWMRRHPALEALAVDAVRGFATRGVMRPEFSHALLDTLLPSHPGYYGEMVWIVMMLELWLRAHAPDFSFRP